MDPLLRGNCEETTDLFRKKKLPHDTGTLSLRGLGTCPYPGPEYQVLVQRPDPREASVLFFRVNQNQAKERNKTVRV